MNKIEYLKDVSMGGDISRAPDNKEIQNKINEIIDVVNNKSNVIIVKIKSSLPSSQLRNVLERMQLIFNSKGLNTVLIPVNDLFDLTVVSGDMKVMNISGKDYTAEEIEEIAKEISGKCKE